MTLLVTILVIGFIVFLVMLSGILSSVSEKEGGKWGEEPVGRRESVREKSGKQNTRRGNK
ncbi:MAG: hypothetical protein WD491_08690 [Balneolales bacterium]